MAWIKHHIRDLEKCPDKRKRGEFAPAAGIKTGDIINVCLPNLRGKGYTPTKGEVLEVLNGGNTALVKVSGISAPVSVPLRHSVDAGGQRITFNPPRTRPISNYKPPRPFNMDVVNAGATRR